MSKIKSALFLALFFFTQAASAACPIITGISPTSLAPSSPGPSQEVKITGSGFTQPGATLEFLGGSIPLTTTSTPPGVTVTDTLITIAPNAIPDFIGTVGTQTLSVSSNSCATPPPNHPFDYFTFTGDWKALIPVYEGKPAQIGLHIYDIDGTNLYLNSGMPAEINGAYTVLSDPTGAFAYCLGVTRGIIFEALYLVDITAHFFKHTTPFDFITMGSNTLFEFAQPMAISPTGKYLIITGTDGDSHTWLLQLAIPIPMAPTAMGPVTPVHAYDLGNLGTQGGPSCVAFLPDSDDTAYLTLFGVDPKILVFDLTNPQTATNPFPFTDLNLDIPHWIAPAPVNKDFTSTSYVEMVLNNARSSEAIFYNQLPLIQTPPYPKIFGSTGGFSFGFVLPQIVASPDSTVAYVTNQGFSGNQAIAVVDNLLGAPAISNYFMTSLAPFSHGIAITPDGQGGIVADRSSAVTFLHTQTLTATTAIPNVGGSVGYSCITPDQAPVAYAQVTNISGLTVSFDASASLSPTGFFGPTNNGIKDYIWDFGDGPPVTTTSPMITHTFANGGAKTVTLTVVNNAGTSTADKTRYFGQMCYNNGGPQAQLQLKFTLSNNCNPNLLPPSKVRVSRNFYKCRFRNTLFITPPTSGPTTLPTSYLISADPKGKSILQTVPANGSKTVKSKPIKAPCPNACYYVFSVLDGSVSCNFTKSCSE